MDVLYHHRTRGKGAEGAHIKGIVMAFRDMGHEVTLTSIHNVDPTKPVVKQDVTKEEPKTGLKSRIFELTKHMPECVFETLEILYNIIALRQIRNEIKKKRPTIIYERYSLFMFASVWYAKKKNIPIILEINDSALVDRVRHLLFKGLACKIEKWIFQNATGLVFISSFFEGLAKSHYKHIAPSVVSPNAADINVFNPKKYDGKKAKAKYNLSGKTVCGFAGAFHPWHGIDWFIKEVIEPLKQYPHLALLLIGDGSCHKFIVDLAKKYGMESQIVMAGRISHDSIPEAIAAMDFGIIPDSNDYGSPMKLFEFMAMGKGMIVPDFEPIKEVVTDNQNSWLFEKQNKEKCVARFFEIAQDKQLLKKVGENALEYIVKSRQWQHNAEAIIRLTSNK